jgi:hypothetical protein
MREGGAMANPRGNLDSLPRLVLEILSYHHKIYVIKQETFPLTLLW